MSLPTHKVPYGGRMVDAEIVPVRDQIEAWNVYQLEDGSRVKIKIVVSEVYRIIGEYKPDGSPVYYIEGTNVTISDSPQTLMKREG